MTYYEQLMAEIAARFDLMDQRCSEVEETMSDLRQALLSPFAGLNTL